MIEAEKAFKKLMDGNNRFVNNKSIHPNRCQETKDSLLSKQTPYAVVLSCSDSRVPIEIIFDVGFGDLFVIRTAGHVLSQDVMGSIEYAIRELKVKLIMILGHDNCGAVKNAIKAYKNRTLNELSPNLKSIMTQIYPAIEQVDHDQDDLLSDAIHKNVEFQAADLLQKDAYIAEKITSGEVMLVKANYNLKTSEIEIF